MIQTGVAIYKVQLQSSCGKIYFSILLSDIGNDIWEY